MKKAVLIASIAVSVLMGGSDTLRYVIDGDTAVFKTQTCRFAYVDTPESKNNKKAQRDSRILGIELNRIYQAGRYAKRYTKSLLHKGREYRIDTKGKDRYGRSICVIYTDNGDSINDMLVENGFARPFWRYIPKRLKPHFRNLAVNAERKNKGLWRIDREFMMRFSNER